MKLTTIQSGFFKLDGGAMFGVVPKTMWNKVNEADENNLCTWAMRCLLIETGKRKILIDTGLGNKQSEKFRSHFHPHGDFSLTNSLKENGLSNTDITDVFLLKRSLLMMVFSIPGACTVQRKNCFSLIKI